ncbi:hypothetical protein JNUCC1_03112 [Lentibacillus sp. JNUCC-1]|uniref:thioredoxin family protein n=1 Tax=Lentibacillus sp. JNUCC-1 TaxID=2654513 RepID=UPI0012E8A6B4|nr:thioredoxin family protein [Lentibacillus sp. JNUCC-1]MUV39239.1 hypothetical protein [Lentibacillus sp. JNUCC-1]
MNLNDWFSIGMTPEKYINAMNHFQDETQHIYEQFQIPDDEAFLQALKDRSLRVIVLTEDWCGDAMLNVPVLLNIAEAANMPVSILQRDTNLDLMDQYLTNGKSRSIPIFIFIDEEGNEVAKWGPRADVIQTFVNHSLSSLPPQDDADHDEKKKEMYLFLTKSYRDNPRYWKDVYDSIKQRLESSL